MRRCAGFTPRRAVMVATPTLQGVLSARGFERLRIWTRGVDTELFRPRDKSFLDAPRPIALYVGRVAVEKNIEAFLNLELPGSKYVVGDGPQLAQLKRRHPGVHFVGYQHGEDSRATTPPPMSSSFPRAPTPSGWCCLNPWPRACPSPPFRWRAPST
jgi:Glycosyltransferase